MESSSYRAADLIDKIGVFYCQNTAIDIPKPRFAIPLRLCEIACRLCVCACVCVAVADYRQRCYPAACCAPPPPPPPLVRSCIHCDIRSSRTMTSIFLGMKTNIFGTFRVDMFGRRRKYASESQANICVPVRASPSTLWAEVNLHHMYKPSPYRAVKTLPFGYKSQSVSVVWGNNRCSETHTKHINTAVWAERRIVGC